MLATVRTASVLGVTGQPVTVEVHIASGLPSFTVVGSPDETCREARDRVRAAIVSSGLCWPQKRITVNLSPSGVRKAGSGLDLAIAVAVLIADETMVDGEVLAPESTAPFVFVAELGLDGRLRPVPGVAPMVASQADAVPVVAPDSWAEACAVSTGPVRTAPHLVDVLRALGGADWPPAPRHDGPSHGGAPAGDPVLDLADVRGQPVARLGLELAAAGGHHLLLVGPPGSGKTMLAQRLVGLLPDLDPSAMVEATMIHSAAGVRLPPDGLVRRPPFRAPHHTSSMVALVGGGAVGLRPGEVSLASGGVLFLDELGEFAPSVLDALRQPLEDGTIRVARAAAHAVLPARFQLVAATNPCPCGGGPPGSCVCDESTRHRYLRRLSGPLLDRFDLRIGVQRTAVDDLLAVCDGEPTADVAQRVARARRRAVERQEVLNAGLSPSQLDQVAVLDTGATALLRHELEHGRLTGRGLHRVRRVARTIADLDVDEHDSIAEQHVALALRLRVRLRIDDHRAAVPVGGSW